VELWSCDEPGDDEEQAEESEEEEEEEEDVGWQRESNVEALRGERMAEWQLSDENGGQTLR
jgi:hypothetical protein